MAGSDQSEKTNVDTKQGSIKVQQDQKHIALDAISRSKMEGAFVSPCGTEGARWEGFPEWPEEFPYDAFGDGWAGPGEKEDKK
jgi:hypothetical protein